jgi:diamine N-acetyltransferase
MLALRVHPDQLRFVADFEPIAALILAKAHVGATGFAWRPVAIYEGDRPAGMVGLATAPATPEMCWIRHFFIDRDRQGRGIGGAALQALLALVRREYAPCRRVLLTVHPENTAAQSVYRRGGFVDTGEVSDGEPVYAFDLD